MVRELIRILAFGLSMALATAGAEACRVRRPPVIPIIADYDAVAFATVTRHDEGSAEARLDEVIEGRVDSGIVRLHFGIVQRQGDIVITSCGPPGPNVRTGDRLVVVFGRHEGGQYVQGWVTRADAERDDDFFALYGREEDRVERRLLRRRWSEMNRHRGPVPLSDPARWMAPHAGGLRWTTGEGATHVQFDVDRQGNVVNCRFWQAAAPPLRDATVCESLRRRRFKPPLFERERHGMYEVRWRGGQ